MGRAPQHVQSYYREQLAHLHDNQVSLLKYFVIFFVEYFSFFNPLTFFFSLFGSRIWIVVLYQRSARVGWMFGRALTTSFAIILWSRIWVIELHDSLETPNIFFLMRLNSTIMRDGKVQGEVSHP